MLFLPLLCMWIRDFMRWQTKSKCFIFKITAKWEPNDDTKRYSSFIHTLHKKSTFFYKSWCCLSLFSLNIYKNAYKKPFLLLPPYYAHSVIHGSKMLFLPYLLLRCCLFLSLFGFDLHSMMMFVFNSLIVLVTNSSGIST